jgi:hypothetical protein
VGEAEEAESDRQSLVSRHWCLPGDMEGAEKEQGWRHNHRDGVGVGCAISNTFVGMVGNGLRGCAEYGWGVGPTPWGE